LVEKQGGQFGETDKFYPHKFPDSGMEPKKFPATECNRFGQSGRQMEKSFPQEFPGFPPVQLKSSRSQKL